MKYSLLIAIEDYLDKHKIPKVDYAKNDLIELKKALENIGYNSDNCLDLLNDSATKTRIESTLNQLCDCVNKDDEIIFYYAGHGFAEKGNNYITCYDTLLSAAESTSISIQQIFEQLRAACNRVIFFFDSCHSGFAIDESMRGLYSDMNDNEFKQALKDNSYCVGFAACKANERSYSITQFQHGAWTHHLIECLNGRIPAVLEKGGLLTATALQFYLHDAVPKSLRDYHTDRSHKQTPWMFGGQEQEIILGDLSHLLKRKSTPPPKVNDVELRSVDYGSIKNLSGFERSRHRVPDNISSATMSFVSRISRDELNNESNRILDILRTKMGYKRKDLETEESDYGISFQTPDFTISVTIEQDEEDCSQYKQTITMQSIDYDFISSEKFNDAFDDLFDTLVITLDKKIDIAEFVDQIEALDRDDIIKIGYGTSLSECSLEIDGIEGKMTIRGNEISTKFNWNTSPQKMIESVIGMGKNLNALGCDQLLLE